MTIANLLVNGEFRAQLIEENHLEPYTDNNNDLMEEWAYLLTAAVLFIIGFFGFFLNIIVITLMCKDIQVS